VEPPVEPNRRIAPGGNCPCCRTTVCWTTVCWTLVHDDNTWGRRADRASSPKILRQTGWLTAGTAGIIPSRAGSSGT